MREKVESTFVGLIIASGAMVIVGVLLLMMGLGAGGLQMVRQGGVGNTSAMIALLGCVGLLGGLALGVFTIFTGTAMGGLENRGVRKVDPNVKVIARYATNAQGETSVLDWEFEDPKTRFYARLQLGDGTRAEFQCAREVFDQCGEGMRGEAQFQGRWLGSFRPYIGQHS